MTIEKISELNCPKCGLALENGFITGHWIRLRWTKVANTKTILAGTPLMKKRDMWNAPTVPARRCHSCKIGVFCYDN